MTRTAFAGAAAALAFAATAAAEPLQSWLGTWSNPSSSGLVGLDITLQGGNLKVTGRGSCTPNPCEWGVVDGAAHAPNPGVNPTNDTVAIAAEWNHGFSVASVILNRNADGSLQAQMLTHFTDNSGRSDYSSTTTLTKSMVLNPGLIGAVALAIPRDDEDCIGFDPETVQAQQVDGRWKVVSGTMWMLDAGSERDEMRTAATIIRNYGLAHQCYVGRPDPSLEYWLTPTGAPTGRALRNEDCVSVDPNALSVSGSGSQWTVLDGPSHAAFSAPSQAEAQRIVEIVQRYGFTESCFVGRPGPSMRYLRR